MNELKYMKDNFWIACEESWPEFFLFLGIISAPIFCIFVYARVILGLPIGPEVPGYILFTLYLWWAPKS